MHVSGDWVGNGGSPTAAIDTYMEYYEEYLEHNDPLDQHLQPGELYEGLSWGLRGVDTRSAFGLVGNEYYQVYYTDQASTMTGWVINRNDAVPMSTVRLFNDSEPASAFHYCYGKNKRNADGSVAEGHWYMPGIRELERALVQYYLTFDDFQGQLYWSASSAQRGGSLIGGYTYNHARATKVNMVDGKPQYIESSSGNEGYQDRNNRLRIRAFYRL